MNWIYQNKELNSISELPNPEALFGFVYIVRNRKDNKFYIGRKNFYTKRKKNLTKKEKSTDKRLKTYKHVVAESNWKTYTGSCVELNEDIATFGSKYFKKEIIHLAYSAKELTYLELEYMFKHNVLRVNNSYNNNIAGKHFRRDLNIEV